jgi:NAD(P)-dependent dehydrogenase (short-subunit alcohol dehydrogenase family)
VAIMPAVTGESKTANVLFAVGMTQKFGAEGEGINANAVHPGGISCSMEY